MLSMSSARSTISQATTTPRPYVSKVGILPSSLPAYHKDYMEREKAGSVENSPPKVLINDEPQLNRTDAEKEETARRLRPHSRSQLRIDEANTRPQGMTPINPPKKTKPVRWQFGIRSRNSPWEALLCIHKALYKLGATYIPDEDYESRTAEERAEASGDSSFVDSHDGYRGSTSSIDPKKRYNLPADPWHINVRWDTSGMLLLIPPLLPTLTSFQLSRRRLAIHPARLVRPARPVHQMAITPRNHLLRCTWTYRSTKWSMAYTLSILNAQDMRQPMGGCLRRRTLPAPSRF